MMSLFLATCATTTASAPATRFSSAALDGGTASEVFPVEACTRSEPAAADIRAIVDDCFDVPGARALVLDVHLNQPQVARPTPIHAGGQPLRRGAQVGRGGTGGTGGV